MFARRLIQNTRMICNRAGLASGSHEGSHARRRTMAIHEILFRRIASSRSPNSIATQRSWKKVNGQDWETEKGRRWKGLPRGVVVRDMSWIANFTYTVLLLLKICLYTWQNVHKVSSSYIEYEYLSCCVLCSKSDIATCPDRPLTKV